MSQLTETNLQDTLSTQQNAEEASSLASYDKIEGTPFTVVGLNGKYFLAMGNHRLTEVFDSSEEAAEQLSKNMWEIVMQIVVIVAEALRKKIE